MRGTVRFALGRGFRVESRRPTESCVATGRTRSCRAADLTIARCCREVTTEEMGGLRTRALVAVGVTVGLRNRSGLRVVQSCVQAAYKMAPCVTNGDGSGGE